MSLSDEWADLLPAVVRRAVPAVYAADAGSIPAMARHFFFWPTHGRKGASQPVSRQELFYGLTSAI
jgi:hypothetical protein